MNQCNGRSSLISKRRIIPFSMPVFVFSPSLHIPIRLFSSKPFSPKNSQSRVCFLRAFSAFTFEYPKSFEFGSCRTTKCGSLTMFWWNLSPKSKKNDFVYIVFSYVRVIMPKFRATLYLNFTSKIAGKKLVLDP